MFLSSNQLLLKGLNKCSIPMNALANLSTLDFALLPFYLAIIYSIAYKVRNRKYSHKHPWRKYYIPALTIKIFGALFIGLVYGYYYKGGDTYYYFNQAQVLNSAFNESFEKWLNLLFHIPKANDGNYYEYISRMEWYNDPSSYTVVSITAFLSFFTLNTYLSTAVLFAFISFSGIWALFRTFSSLYPHLTRPIAIAILFIPSVFVWGSGIFKDTICLFGLGWLTYGTFRFLVQKDFSFRNILISVLSFALVATVKLYILLGFAPALLMWVFFNYSQGIKNKSQKILVKSIFIIIIIVGFLFFMQRFANELGKYSLEKVAETSKITSGYIYFISGDEGSAYSLGNYSPTIGGMISKFPVAVNVTLFRPYIWEAKKTIVALSAIEALLFLFLTLKVLFTVGPAKIWKTISSDPTIQFCFIFSIIFAFAVGISSYNFGTLSRYKIPCMPFYALGLMLLYYKNNPAKKPLLSSTLGV
jgi:hypothetical protein